MEPRPIVSREDWQSARDALLTREKQLTRTSEELARLRRDLPWTPFEDKYSFQTADGPRSLADLFDGRSQLVVYHFMFGPDYDAGCPVCSSIADSFDGILEHLAARDVTMVCISRAPLDKLLAYRERMGWHFNWASSADSGFNFDFGHTVPREVAAAWVEDPGPVVSRFANDCGTDPPAYVAERPGLSVFARSGDDVFLTYETTARGLEPIMTYYGIFDLVPNGREGEPPDPGWVRRHDEFE